MKLRRAYYIGVSEACRWAGGGPRERLLLPPTGGGASDPTRGGRRSAREVKLCRKPMCCSSASRGTFNPCRLKQSTGRAAAVAVGLVFLQLQCSGGTCASTLAPHLAAAAPLTTSSTGDSIRSPEFLGWRSRRRQGPTESRTLLAGAAGLVADSAGKCGSAVGAEASGEWRGCSAWNQQQLLVEGVESVTVLCVIPGIIYVLGYWHYSGAAYVVGSALSLCAPAMRRLLRSASCQLT